MVSVMSQGSEDLDSSSLIDSTENRDTTVQEYGWTSSGDSGKCGFLCK